MQPIYIVILLWNHTAVCKPGALIVYRVLSVFFASGIKKGLRWNKRRHIKISYLSRGKIGRTGKYWSNSKIKTKQKNPPKIEKCLFLQISSLSKKWVDFTKDRLALYPSEATNIFHLLAASGFSNTISLGWSWRWCSNARNFITKQLFVIAHVKIKGNTRTFITVCSF